MKIRITIGGYRKYDNYDVFCKNVDAYISETGADEITILSGHCSGVDMMAERYAAEKGYCLEVYPAEWDRYGLAAGPMRNQVMVVNSDMVIAFWNGTSKGTRNLIDTAKKLNKILRVVDISNG